MQSVLLRCIWKQRKWRIFRKHKQDVRQRAAGILCGFQGFLTHNPAAFVEIDDIFDCFRYPLRDIWNRLNAWLSRHTLSTELIFIRFALPQNDFDTCIRRRNVVIWLKRNLSFHLQCFLQRLCTCFCTFYCQSNTQNIPGQQRFVFCTKSWFFLPPEHVSMAFSQYMRSSLSWIEHWPPTTATEHISLPFLCDVPLFVLAKPRWSTVVRPRIDHYWKLTDFSL